jgi:predicted acylesterase/phospholipase RssA/CRP-like cAMP-binding protein
MRVGARGFISDLAKTRRLWAGTQMSTTLVDPSHDFRPLLDGLERSLPALRRALLDRAAGELERIDLRPGDVLLREGDEAHALYVLAKGSLRATTLREDGSEFTLSEFGPGEMAGEISILAGSGRYTATVSAVEATVLVRISRSTFERLAKEVPDAIREMAGGIKKRVARNQLAVGLTRLFGPLDEKMLKFVEERIDWVALPAGETLFSEGDRGEELYFVLGGRLRAVARGGRVLNEMTRGESIGEMALLTGEMRTATVLAVRDSDLVRVSRTAFEEIVARYPVVMQTIARVVVQRLMRKEKALPARAGKCIAVLQAGEGNVSSNFTAKLVSALEKVGPTLHLSAQRIETLLNRPGMASVDETEAAGIRLRAWLDEQETQHQFLVYEADLTISKWTRRCLRQADEVVLVADAAGGPMPNQSEASLLGGASPISTASQNLVLVHSDRGQRPAGTSQWLGGRHIHRSFHVRLDNDEDFHRLARCLGDAAVGLVLGGGGARGLAHIGVVRALREAGVPIDMIGGTSMGAIQASLVAMGQDWKQMLETNRDVWFRHRPHKEYSLPFISLIRSRRLDAMAKTVYGDAEIEDLWLNFFCISCNLSTSATVVHERGLLWKAIRASGSLPGVFVPVLDDGNILVDGGLVNNLPGDIMRQRSCRSVIVVDVGSEQEFVFKMQEFPSPWQYLRGMLPFARRMRVPHIVDVLMRTTDVSSSQKTREVKKSADLCLRPPIDHYGVLQFERLEEIAEVGYRYAKESLAKLPQDNSIVNVLHAV